MASASSRKRSRASGVGGPPEEPDRHVSPEAGVAATPHDAHAAPAEHGAEDHAADLVAGPRGRGEGGRRVTPEQPLERQPAALAGLRLELLEAELRRRSVSS